MEKFSTFTKILEMSNLTTTKSGNTVSFRFTPEPGKTPEVYINELVRDINNSSVCGLVHATKVNKPTKTLNLKINGNEDTGINSKQEG